ncbi:hypothetical protein MHYP_G00304540 [Metynnis hypsauchen]
MSYEIIKETQQEVKYAERFDHLPRGKKPPETLLMLPCWMGPCMPGSSGWVRGLLPARPGGALSAANTCRAMPLAPRFLCPYIIPTCEGLVTHGDLCWQRAHEPAGMPMRKTVFGRYRVAGSALELSTAERKDLAGRRDNDEA